MAVPMELREEVLLAAFEKYSNYTSPLAKYFPAFPSPGASNTIAYDVLDFNRAMTPLVSYDATAPISGMPARTKVAFEAPTYKEKINVPASVLRMARDVGRLDNVQQAIVARAIAQMRLNMERRWDFLRAQWLTAGALLSSDGEAPTVPDGTVRLDTRFGSKTTPLGIKLGFNPTHIDTAVAASWATADTDIKGDLDAAAEVIMRDSGLQANRVICNSTVFSYILKCTAYTKSEWAREQIDRTGKLNIIWGYEFDVIDLAWPFDSLSMNSDTGGTGLVKLIPGNMCILTVANNDAAGRYMVECKPSNARAPEDARGAYMFSYDQTEDPHNPVYGIEWTGGPMLAVPDSTYIFTDVTNTSG